MPKMAIVLLAGILIATSAFAATGAAGSATPAANQLSSAASAPSYDPASTTEVPSTLSQAPPAAQATGSAASPGDSTPSVDSSAEQEPLPPNIASLQDFLAQGAAESPLGLELHQECIELAGQEVCGLAVLGVRPGSPAAKAGIQPYHALTHHLLDGATVAAALFFPPAIMAIGIIDSTHIGESFDLIIGIDGERVRNVVDFEDLTGNLRPGDIVYVMIVRSGKRLQIPVHLPAGFPVANW